MIVVDGLAHVIYRHLVVFLGDIHLLVGFRGVVKFVVVYLGRLKGRVCGAGGVDVVVSLGGVDLWVWLEGRHQEGLSVHLGSIRARRKRTGLKIKKII